MKKRKRRSAAQDLAEERRLDEALRTLIWRALQEAKKGVWVAIRIDGRAIKRLAEFQEQREKECECN
jgi:hypothetical protein